MRLFQYSCVRASTRFLAFFVIAELIISVWALQKIYVEKMWKEYRRSVVVTLALFLITLATLAVLIKREILPNEVGTFYIANSQSWLKSIVMYVIIIGILYLVPKVSQRNVKVVPIILAFATLMDTYFINIEPATDVFRQKYMVNASTHEQFMDSQIADELEKLDDLDIYNYYVSCDSVWADWEKTHLSIKANSNIYRYMRSLQSYITFNNPMLLELSCADYFGMTMNNMSTMAVKNPTLLDMLSVKYIVQYVENDERQEYVSSNVLYENYSPVYIGVEQNYLLPIETKAEEDYHFAGQVDSINGGGDLVLSNGESIVVIKEGIQKGTNHYSKIIDGSFFEGKEVYLSLVGGEQLSLMAIKIEEIDYLMDLNYVEIYNDGVHKIYQNDDARPLLYASGFVQEMKDAKEYIVANKQNIDFCEYSIIEEEQESIRDYSETNVSINIIEKKNDLVKAEVVSEGGNTFVNFTQNYYPGWNVYVDGVKGELKCVNGLIQGVEVPMGNHIIEFVYESRLIWIGLIISVLFVLLTVMIIAISNRKSVKEYSKNS